MALESVEQHKSFGGMQGVYKHASETLSCDMEFSVYVPPQTNSGAVPVLYYLSGLTCTQENVTAKGCFQKYAAQHGLIVVAPDTSPRGTDYPGEHDDYDFGSGAGFYVDATQEPWSQTYHMYSYVTGELPTIINAEFPVDASRAGIFGHSMGGHGALTIGLKNPGKYRSISAFSPIVAPSQVPWGQKALSGYLGDDKQSWKDHDAVELVKSGHTVDTEILIDQGSADPFLRQHLRPELFEMACRETGQSLNLRMQEGYDHSYFFISSFMEDHIRHHAKYLQGDG